MIRRTICLILAALLPAASFADTITIPAGTTVFCELDARVTSRKKETAAGDMVPAHVWQDVWVDGELAIRAWTPVYVQVSRVQKAKIAGRKGKLELQALNVAAVDGANVPLSGGYDQSGRGRMGLSIALAAVVAWPLIFIKGKQAVLEPGVVFDATVVNPVEVTINRTAASPPKLRMPPDLEVAILYDDLDPDAKIQDLPLRLVNSRGEVADAAVVAVNGQSIAALPIRLQGPSEAGGVRGLLDFKALSKHFTRGMNRFDVRAGDATVEVLLEIEL